MAQNSLKGTTTAHWKLSKTPDKTSTQLKFVCAINVRVT